MPVKATLNTEALVHI